MHPGSVLFALLVTTTCASAREADQVHVGALNGAARVVSLNHAGPRIVLFWRSDCVPCLLELENLKAFEAAAQPQSIAIVALESKAKAAETLAHRHISTDHAWAAVERPEDVLVRLGGAPPRLPLSIALDRAGAICARRSGILGTDYIRDWVKQCSA